MPDEHQAPERTVPLDAPQLQVSAKNPRRAEMVVAITFLISMAGFGAFGGAFWQAASNYWLGGTLGIGMCFFGIAFVAWGKYLMPRGPFEEPRALMTVTAEQRAELVSDFASRGKVAIERRGFLAVVMGGAATIFGVVAVFPLLRSLGPLPKHQLYVTKWKKGSYLTTIDGRRLKVDDVAVGGIATVFPENDVGSAISQTVLIHLQSGSDSITTMPGREGWGPYGYLAYSKVCTHAGCPVGLYEQLTEQLLCPCHQSLFVLRKGAIPIFGPAPRPLPQLPLYVDGSGYLRAQKGYGEPIGPGFWERGGTT
ncbi:MAG TPA: Rieske 2Fe-2S domain-containing protein [Acidimicrobiales bacterium]|nr:Rieske 2Fe-2S domain-containing protein [Acidimicrobiales bacterium]